MLFRFSLYGFLRNQRYFEPFFVLYLLDRGLSYFEIGLLIAFRELIVNLLEIPSGVVADSFGRIRTMILSLCVYAASFVVYGLAHSLSMLFLATFLYAVGESCRTGTHKAMIFDWLRRNGRTEEKSKIYGYTRSWSKIGAAVSLPLAGGIVLWTKHYDATFYASAALCLAGVINLLGYPRYLEGETHAGVSLREILKQLGAALQKAFADRRFRQLMVESMGYEGVFKAVKDYLQPIVKTAALPLAAMLLVTSDLSEPQQVVLLAVPVFVALNLLAALASRMAYRVVASAGGEEAAAEQLWLATIAVFAALFIAGVAGASIPLIVAFVLLYALQNVWRPIQISRFEPYAESRQGAALLSVENQSRNITTMLAAPLVGLAVDAVKARGLGGEFWPVGAVGLCVAFVFYLVVRRSRAQLAAAAPMAEDARPAEGARPINTDLPSPVAAARPKSNEAAGTSTTPD